MRHSPSVLFDNLASGLKTFEALKQNVRFIRKNNTSKRQTQLLAKLCRVIGVNNKKFSKENILLKRTLKAIENP